MSKTTLLIVDDSRYVHKLVAAYLEPEPLELHSAYDGESGLKAAAELRPALVLLDLDMPEMDGFEVCRRLKANPITTASAIIFLTADMSLHDKVKGLDMGAADYVTKPFKPEELRARVRAALRAKHSMESASLVDGLTGLWNRSYLDIQLASQLSLAQRSGRALSCVMLDIDGLGAINETHGRAMGDQVLRSVARIFLSQCRAEDTVCRGEEAKLVALMGGTHRVAAARIAGRVRTEVENQLGKRGPMEPVVTCSLGVADTEIDLSPSLLDRADAALYGAKESGRNAVSVSRPVKESEAA